MASRSKDGEIIARWLTRNGYVPARARRGKGGARALQDMIERIARGPRGAALTIDGPKGPPRVAQPGVLQLARETGGVDPARTRRELASLVRAVLGPLPRAEALLALRRGVRRAVPIPPEMPDREALAPDRRPRSTPPPARPTAPSASRRLRPGNRE